MDEETPFGRNPMDWALLQPCLKQLTLSQYFTESERYWSRELAAAEASVPVVNLPTDLPYDGDLSDLSSALVGLSLEGMRRSTCYVSLKLYRESCVIMLYSFLEKELHEVCRALIEYTDTEESLNPNGYLAGSQKTLKNICHFNWGDFDPEWPFIYSATEGLRGIRNAYVHSSGEQSLAVREGLIKDILTKHTGKEELDSKYIDLTLKQINLFFNKLRDKIWHSSAVQQKLSQENWGQP